MSPSPRAVVELFTSQGCAKCPPADALLARLNTEPDLIVLSFPIDYWDYLGWRDTSAKPEFTRRQRAYADRRGDHQVYTPQMVFNGRDHLVGSDRAAVERRLATLTPEHRDLTVSVDVATTADSIVVDVGAIPSLAPQTPQRATVWIVRFEQSRTVPVKRGENDGRTLTYTHLVRSLQPIGMWKGSALRIELPKNEIVHDKAEGCAILVQTEVDDAPGPIIGARMIADGHS